MPIPLARLALTLLALAACAHQQPGEGRGDVHEGPCRVDAECPEGKRCGESRGHLSNGRGEIVGDLVTHFCEVPPAVGAGADGE